MRRAIGPRRGSVHRVRSGLMNGRDAQDQAARDGRADGADLDHVSAGVGVGDPLVGVELLRAIGHAGGYVAGAFDSATSSAPRSDFCPLRRRRGAAQPRHRDPARGPAQRRRAGDEERPAQLGRRAGAEVGHVDVRSPGPPQRSFNIEVLREHVAEYLVDFYGPMTDSINAHDESDRLLVAWPTDPTATIEEPVHDPQAIEVSTPEDIVVIRRTDPDAAATGACVSARNSANGCTGVPSSRASRGPAPRSSQGRSPHRECGWCHEDPRGRAASYLIAARRAVPHQLRHRIRSRHSVDPRHRRRRLERVGRMLAQAERRTPRSTSTRRRS